MRVGKVDKRVLGPVLMGFFIMGFCDMVAPITGRIALEFPASRQAAVSFLPTMVFLWFLVLSTPLAALMNRIGRKATALIGYAFTVVGLMVPYVAGEGCALGWYFAGFGLLGVGNTAIQVAMTDDLACDSSSCDSSLRKVCMPTVVFTSCRICERFSMLYDLSFSASMISSSCPVILLSTVSDDDELT